MLMLLFLAAVLHEDFIFTLLYLFAGAYFVGHWWSRTALRSVHSQRILPPAVFLDEMVPVQLKLSNSGWLPVVWLKVIDKLPVDLASPSYFRRVVSLGPREQLDFSYMLKARKRGYYRIGPLAFHTGDILGLEDQAKREGPIDYLTVYPKIIPLSKIILPSNSPLGTLRYHQPFFEDPTRVMGKREYTAGDSLRRVDWKSSATTGRLQVKQFEPSIALETAIFLNLDSRAYQAKARFQSTELAIVVAASLANWLVDRKQSVGLISNGFDPLGFQGRPQSLPSRKGRGHLMRLLATLARLQTAEAEPFLDLLRRESKHLSWGTTIILVTGQVDLALFDELFQIRRAGQNPVLVLCGQLIEFSEIQHRAAHFGFPLYQIYNEQDLDIWR